MQKGRILALDLCKNQLLFNYLYVGVKRKAIGLRYVGKASKYQLNFIVRSKT